jgi:energy-coupling factor transport system ATP-binding protein
VAGRRFPRVLLTGCAATAVITFASNALFAADRPLLRFFVFRVSEASMERGALLATRIAAMMLLSIAYIAVTSKYEILVGLRGLRVPRKVAFYLMVVLRYIDIFQYEFDITVRAVKVRGLRLDEGGLGRRIRAYGSLAMPMMARLINRVHTQALAVDSRGILGRGSRVEGTGRRAVEVADLSIFYGDDERAARLALQDASFQVGWGEFVFVAGPTDAGKTTLLLACSGLVPHSLGRMRGRLRVAGHDTREKSMPELAQLARYVFPNPVHGLVGLTVRDELEQAVSAAPATEHMDSREALARVGLQERFLERSTLHLSGGEMQRVQLASALAARPAVLLLDEPTVQLDPQGKEEVLKALEVLRAERSGRDLTILLADPNFQALQRHITRVLVLAEGRLSGSFQRGQTGDVDWMQPAHLRVPQLARLGRRLGVELPPDPGEAARVLGPRPVPASPTPGTPRKNQPLVIAEGVAFRYPDGTEAIRQVDLKLGAGEFVFLLGANGSGKTTLSLLLAKAFQPSGGSILWEERVRVGYVFQEPGLQVVATTVRDELAFGPRNLGWPEERVREVTERELGRFALMPEANPLEMTRSQARKLGIGSLLTMEPTILILDEPTNGLDERETRDLLKLLEHLRGEGMGLLVITHDLELAAEFATRIIVMKDGRILADAKPRAVISDAKLLGQAYLTPPPVVSLSRKLWPDLPPALTVEELVSCLQSTTEQQPSVEDSPGR